MKRSKWLLILSALLVSLSLILCLAACNITLVNTGNDADSEQGTTESQIASDADPSDSTDSVTSEDAELTSNDGDSSSEAAPSTSKPTTSSAEKTSSSSKTSSDTSSNNASATSSKPKPKIDHDDTDWYPKDRW